MLSCKKFDTREGRVNKLSIDSIRCVGRLDNSRFCSLFPKSPAGEFVMQELQNDPFQKEDGYSIGILSGPYGHPYSGRPIVNSEGTEKMSFLDWLFAPSAERKLYKRPKLLIENLFSLGDIEFDDDITRYHKEIISEACKTAKGFIGKDCPISIPICDLNEDGLEL